VIALAYQSPSRRVTRLLSTEGEAVLAVAAAGGRVTYIGTGVAKAGELVAKPLDSVINARYGIVQAMGETPAGTSLAVQLRSGQAAQPDDSWSAWSPEVAAPGNVTAGIPSGRFVQAKVILRGDGKATPSLRRVRIAYLRSNLRPFVREIVSLRKGIALAPIIKPPQGKAKTINLQEVATAEQKKEEEEEERDGDGSGRARAVDLPGALTLKWVADDPNGDELSYALMVREVGNGGWRELEDELPAPFYTLDSAQLPDGHYQFKVTASDAPSNPEGLAQSDAKASEAILIDNTAPRFATLRVDVRGDVATAQSEIQDAVGPLVELAYALDGDPFLPLAPDDGVLDGPRETITLQLSKLDPGHHTLTVRTRDEGQNVASAEARFQVQ
jgi:hypothetical protein